MSDTNPTPPLPDGEPSWTPPPAPAVPPAPPTGGTPPSPPLPGELAATPPPTPPSPPGPPTAPGGPPAPGQYGAPPSAPPPPGQWGAPPAAPGAPGGFPPAGQQPYPQQPYPQQPLAQPYIPGAYGDRFVPELGVNIGSKGKRIGAKAIDLAIVLVVQVVLSIIVAAVLIGTNDNFGSTEFGTDVGTNIAATLVAAVITLGFDFFYSVFCTAKFGGTPGKLMVGLRVISQDGPPADMAVAFRRWTPSLALIVLGVIPIVSIFAGLARFGLLIANLVMVLVDERSRDVFDHVGRTYVIDKQ